MSPVSQGDHLVRTPGEGGGGLWGRGHPLGTSAPRLGIPSRCALHPLPGAQEGQRNPATMHHCRGARRRVPPRYEVRDLILYCLDHDWAMGSWPRKIHPNDGEILAPPTCQPAPGEGAYRGTATGGPGPPLKTFGCGHYRPESFGLDLTFGPRSKP